MLMIILDVVIFSNSLNSQALSLNPTTNMLFALLSKLRTSTWEAQINSAQGSKDYYRSLACSLLNGYITNPQIMESPNIIWVVHTLQISDIPEMLKGHEIGCILYCVLKATSYNRSNRVGLGKQLELIGRDRRSKQPFTWPFSRGCFREV